MLTNLNRKFQKIKKIVIKDKNLFSLSYILELQEDYYENNISPNNLESELSQQDFSIME